MHEICEKQFYRKSLKKKLVKEKFSGLIPISTIHFEDSGSGYVKMKKTQQKFPTSRVCLGFLSSFAESKFNFSMSIISSHFPLFVSNCVSNLYLTSSYEQKENDKNLWCFLVSCRRRKLNLMIFLTLSMLSCTKCVEFKS